MFTFLSEFVENTNGCGFFFFVSFVVPIVKEITAFRFKSIEGDTESEHSVCIDLHTDNNGLNYRRTRSRRSRLAVGLSGPPVDRGPMRVPPRNNYSEAETTKILCIRSTDLRKRSLCTTSSRLIVVRHIENNAWVRIHVLLLVYYNKRGQCDNIYIYIWRSYNAWRIRGIHRNR